MFVVIGAFALGLGCGFYLSMYGFAFAWFTGLAVYVALFIPAGTGVAAATAMAIAVGGAAQVGYFAAMLIQVMIQEARTPPAQRASSALIKHVSHIAPPPARPDDRP